MEIRAGGESRKPQRYRPRFGCLGSIGSTLPLPCTAVVSLTQRGDLAFATVSPRALQANAKSKTTLESDICQRFAGSDIRKRTRRDMVRMSESRRWFDSGSSMAEAADELSAPLGRDITRGKRRFRLPFTKMQVLATALGLFLLIFAGYALFTEDPFGGEPLVRIAIGPSGDDKPAAKPGEMSAEKQAEKSTMSAHGGEPLANSSKAAASSDQRTVTIIDGSSG